VRLQLVNAADHVSVVDWPLDEPLEEWTIDNMRAVSGLHRHVVRMVAGPTTYVVKELPDPLAEREWRLLRELAEAGLPTVEVVGVVTGRSNTEGLLITRHLEFSLPYRTLLSRNGIGIPYLGQRMLDALAGLLVQLHLAGFYWGDCSLSNTLFRRDAGELAAYIIDVETGERHEKLSDGQRRMDIMIATENVIGGLLDLQAADSLADGIDPVETALAIEHAYNQLWSELTGVDEFNADETFRVDQRLQRLHELGFDAAELELVSSDDGERLRLVPRVVEHGFHAHRLHDLTGIVAGENQSRRLLNDMCRYRAVLEQRSGKKIDESVAADRWLTERFDLALAGIPAEMHGKLVEAELYHQVLEHRWFLSERAGGDVGMEETVASYVSTVLAHAPAEQNVSSSGED
jgi:tRNA A-37 threonylcarbamoyl transferase component Bud32